MNCFLKSPVLDFYYMDNSKNQGIDTTNWTLRDWVMAETGDGQSRAGYIRRMIELDAVDSTPNPLLTQAESEILHGLRFDLAQVSRLAVGSEDPQRLERLFEEIVEQLKKNMLATARARQAKLWEARD